MKYSRILAALFVGCMVVTLTAKGLSLFQSKADAATPTATTTATPTATATFTIYVAKDCLSGDGQSFTWCPPATKCTTGQTVVAGTGPDPASGSIGPGTCLTIPTTGASPTATATPFANVCFADLAAGGDIGAKINSCESTLGSTSGAILTTVPATATTAVVISHNNHTLQFGAGTWTMAGITLSGSNDNITCASSHATILTENDATVPLIDITGAGGNQIRDCWLDRAALPATSGGEGIRIVDNAGQVKLMHLVIQNQYNGILAHSTDWGLIYDVLTQSNYNHGIYLLANVAGKAALQWNMLDGLSQGNEGDGVRYECSATAGNCTTQPIENLSTGSNHGYGINFTAPASSSMNDILVNGLFSAGDNLGVNFSTLGGVQNHVENSTVEFAGTVPNGRGAIHAAGAAAHAWNVAVTTHPITFVNIWAFSNSYCGMNLAASSIVYVSNSAMKSNGINGSTNAQKSGICNAGTVYVNNSALNANPSFGMNSTVDTVFATGGDWTGNTGGAIGSFTPIVSTFYGVVGVTTNTMGIATTAATSVSGGGALSTGSNAASGRITGAAATGNVLTPGFTCPNAVTVSLQDNTTAGGAKVTAQSATTVTFSATAADVVDYVGAGCR